MAIYILGATDNAELRAGSFEKIVGAPSITKEQIPNISVNPWSSKEEAIDFTKECIKTRQTKFQLKLTGITISGQIGAR